MNKGPLYGEFFHDIAAAVLVFQNNGTAAMLLYKTNPAAVQLFSYLNTSVSFNKFARQRKALY